MFLHLLHQLVNSLRSDFSGSKGGSTGGSTRLPTVYERILDLYSLTPKTQRDPKGMSDFFNVEDPDFEVALDQVLERGFK